MSKRAKLTALRKKIGRGIQAVFGIPRKCVPRIRWLDSTDEDYIPTVEEGEVDIGGGWKRRRLQ